MSDYKTSLMLSYNYFKNMQLSKIDRFLNTSMSKPPVVCIMITGKCNSHCRQCDVWKRKPTKELSTEQWKSAISKLKKWIGPFYLNIFGGEPFLRKDLFEIIEFAQNKGIFTDVITNGLLLSARYRELSNSNLSKITVSLDGATAKTHDFLKGHGSFKSVVPAIKTLRKSQKDLIITINSIMLKQNLQELPALVHFVKSNNLNGIFLRILCWEGFNKDYSEDWFLKNPMWPGNDRSKVEKIIGNLIQLKKEDYPIINSVKYLQFAKEYFKNPNILSSKKITCLSPYECLTIFTKGDIKLCSRYPLGNILKNECATIWRSGKRKQLKKELLNCKKACMLRDWRFEDTIISKLSRARKTLFQK